MDESSPDCSCRGGGLSWRSRGGGLGGLGHRKLQPSGDRGDGLGGGPGATASVALGLRAAAQRGHERQPRLGD